MENNNKIIQKIKISKRGKRKLFPLLNDLKRKQQPKLGNQALYLCADCPMSAEAYL